MRSLPSLPWPCLLAGLLACSADQARAPGGSAGGGDAGASGQAGQSSAGTGGSAGQPPEPLVVRAMYYGGNEDEPLLPVEAKSLLELRLPPQGGFVLWIAPEVEGTKSEQVEVHTLVRSAATGLILSEERRTVSGGVSEGDGPWRVMPVGIRNVNNVPVCPNYGDELLIDTDVVLEVAVEDLEATPPRKGKVTLGVRLTCPPLSKICPCECAVGYALGGCPGLEDPG